ncbi:hypothetical protein CGRA01v4_00706 [Colletotrichum graminicola]|nr:hypothetical protein CGRA01v4_00706 [Colletotrichum graminicola]
MAAGCRHRYCIARFSASIACRERGRYLEKL